MAAVANQVHSTAQQIGARSGWNPTDAATQPPTGTREPVLNLSDSQTDHRNLGFEDSCLSGAPPSFFRRFGQAVDDGKIESIGRKEPETGFPFRPLYS
jgi:hypothetical protein